LISGKIRLGKGAVIKGNYFSNFELLYAMN